MYMNNNYTSRSVVDILYIFIFIHFDKNDVNLFTGILHKIQRKKTLFFVREDSNSTWKTSKSNK